jgi:hypothetical protein
MCPTAVGVGGDVEPAVAKVRGDAELVVWAGVGRWCGWLHPIEWPVEWVVVVRGWLGTR